MEIWELLLKLIEEGKTIIVTNHNLVATERYCDKVAILNHGRCMAFGKCEDVISEELLKDVFGVEEKNEITAKHYDIITHD